MSGTTMRAATTWAMTLTCQIRSHVASSAISPSPLPMPALAAKRPTGPNRSVGGVDHGLDLLGRAHVGAETDDPVAVDLGQPRRRGLGVGGVEVDHGHPGGAVGQEAVGQGVADAPACSGDDAGRPVQAHAGPYAR